MYVCSLRTNKWSYDHRQEGAALGQKMSYIRQTAGDRGALKDIQIFGMSSWLRQVHDAVLKLFRAFQLREQRVRLLGDLAEVALTFLRNGAAYGYLLALALGEGLSVSEFLLYFTAVGNFTTWVTGILKGFGELHQFSLELSSVRGYIEAPEPPSAWRGARPSSRTPPCPTPWSCGTCPSGTPGRRRTPCPTST